MSNTIYWIEDEMPTLRGLKHVLAGEGYEFQELGTASEVIKRMPELLISKHSRIILDLYLPTGDNPEVREPSMEGPEVGLWLLQQLKQAGVDLRRVIILSGNIGIDVYEQLQKEFSIPDHAIIGKPVIEVEPLLEALRSPITPII